MKTYREPRNSTMSLGVHTRQIVIPLLWMAALLAQPAFAADWVLDFEDLFPGYEVESSPLPEEYAGFDWSAAAYWQTSQSDPGTGYEYGTIGHVSLYTAWQDSISMGGDPFQLSGAYVTAAWNDQQDFTVEGWLAGALVYSHELTTSNDQPYWFDFSQDIVDTVWFIPKDVPGGNDQLIIDNIHVLPEPATILLLGLGAIASLRKRRA